MRTRLIPALVVLAALSGCMSQLDSAVAIAPNPEPGLIVRWEPCEPDTGVTVIVDDEHIGEGKIYVGCALGAQANGIEALEHAGFDIEGTKQYGLAFICRIDGEPTAAEQTCDETPGANAYWTYYHGKPGGRWGFSGCGAASCKPTIGSVEGWGFNGDGGGAPRIEPMDGRGEHSFTLPPEQESSVIPAVLAREWLTQATLQTASLIEEGKSIGGGGISVGGPSVLERLLEQARALADAGVQPAELAPFAAWLAAGCERHNVMIEGCELRELYDPNEPVARRVAAAVLGLQALGQNTESFAGLDPGATLEGMIESDGKVQQPAGENPTEDVDVLAPTVLALARGGTLSAKALRSVDLLLAQQTATGQFGPDGPQTETSTELEAIQALIAAREQGVAVLGQTRLEAIETALAKAGGYLESSQEPDGGIPPNENSNPASTYGRVESSALGAVGLALTGRRQAAERAAKWVSQYQVTAEYAGRGNTEAGEHTPAEELIGAFTPSEGALKEVLTYGEPSALANEEQEATWPAILALWIVGPYGPYDAVFDQESLFFENRALGSPTKPLAATLADHDVRPVTITALELTAGQSGDFQIAGGNCAGRTLQPGEVCEVQLAFDPSAVGPRETRLQATLAGVSQTIDLPLTGTGIMAPEPQPQLKPEPGPGPVVSPSSLTPAPTHAASGPVVGMVVESISPTQLLLKLTARGVVTVKIAHLLGKGHHRHFQTVKTITVKAGKAGALEIRLPRLAAGSYRVSISFAGAKILVKTLTVPRTRR
jgi:hypothetical protein